jgi:hypothetical protein
MFHQCQSISGKRQGEQLLCNIYLWHNKGEFMLEIFLQSAPYFSTQCRLTLLLSIRFDSEISCAPITADLPWFVS